MESPLRRHDSICKTENQLDEDAQNIALCYIHSSQIFPQIEEVYLEKVTETTHIYGSMKLVIKQRTRDTCDSFDVVNHSGITYIYAREYIQFQHEFECCSY